MNPLWLVFEAGGATWAIEASTVEHVLPRVSVRPVPHAPEGVVGLLNHHGAPVPVVDLSLLLSGEPSCESRLTRIVLVRLEASPAGLLGLLVPGLRDTVRMEPDEFCQAPVRTDGAPWLGGLAPVGTSLVQKVRVEALLPLEVRRSLLLEETRGAAL